VAKIMEGLDRALELHAEHERAHECKAKMLQRLGRPGEALRHFKQVAAINPNNVEAAREVRIATMRVGNDKNSAKTTAVGFVSRLLSSEKEKDEKNKGGGGGKKR
jgi:tetratricopeptide (TPR) repeat protein